MKRKIDQYKKQLIYFIIITLPIMMMIHLTDNLKINVSLSDLFVAFLVILLIIDFRNFSIKENFPYWWYFTAFIGLMMVSNVVAVINGNIQSSGILNIVNEGMKFIIVGFYFYIGYHSISTEKDIYGVQKTWVYTSLVMMLAAVMATLSAYLGNPILATMFTNDASKRLTGTITDPNLAAAYISVSFFITISFVNLTEKSLVKKMGYFALVVLMISMLLTQSRSGIIAFLIALAIYTIFTIKNAYRYVPILILMIFIGYFGTLSVDARYFDKAITTSTSTRFEQIAEQTGEAEVRKNLAKAAWEMGKDHFILGVGRGNFRVNAKPYYEKIGIDTEERIYESQYGIKIPHNTFLTFFAEMGILGLLLFLWIFYRVIKENLKMNKKSILFFSMLVSYLVQALAINLENFRGIWFMLGFILSFNKLAKVEEKSPTVNFSNLPAKKIIIISTLLAVIAIPIYVDAAGQYTKPIQLGRKPLVEYIDYFEPNTEYIFRYYIEGFTDSRERPSSMIKIYSIDQNNHEELLKEITYWSPKGWGNLLFTPNENSKRLKIEILPTHYEGTTTVIKEAKVVERNTGKGRPVFENYKYIPGILEKPLEKWVQKVIFENTTKYRLFANVFADSSKPPIVTDEREIYYDGVAPVNLSDKILFLGATKEELVEGKIKLTFQFQCIGDMDINYRLWLHGRVMDQYILPDERIQYQFANWDHNLKTKTSEWKVGEIYEHQYTIESQEGQYEIKFGFWLPNNEGEAFRLYPHILLGW